MIVWADVLDLIETGRSEDRRLDFKRELPGGKDEDKKEFLADISSLANADGGDIIFGVDEIDGVAAGIPGVAIANPDSDVLRLENLARDGLQPRIVGLRSQYIPDPERAGTGVIIMRAPASLQAPHQVVFQKRNRFYTRHSKGKAEMDVTELRLAFTGSDNIRPRLRALYGMLPKLSTIPLVDGPSLLISVAPVGLFRREAIIEISDYQQAVMPVWGGSLDWTQTLEGFLAWAPTAEGSYAQAMTYRAGWTELWSQQGSLNQPDTKWIWAYRVEGDVEKAVVKALGVLQSHGIEGPWSVQIRLLNVKGYDLYTGDRWAAPTPSNRSEFIFNDLVFDQFEEETLLPTFREIWWAFGQDRPEGWKRPK